MTTTTLNTPRYFRRRAAFTFPAQLLRTLATWNERARQRRALATLTAEQLDDIGIAVATARREAARPFWRA